MSTYLPALGLTLSTELATLILPLLLLKKPVQRPLLVHLGTNLVTHPVFWFCFPVVAVSVSVEARLWVWEIATTVVEGATLLVLGRLRPVWLGPGLAVAANVISFWGGVACL